MIDPKPQITVDAEGPYEIEVFARHGEMAVLPKGGIRQVPRSENPDQASSVRVAGKIFVEGPSEAPEQGHAAPKFRAISFDGRMVDLAALKGKLVWLIFYRYATCPLCNLHLSQVIARYPVFRKAGLEVIAVFESPVPAFFQPGGQRVPLFPTISDPDKKLYGLYGTRKSVLGVLTPGVAIGLGKALLNGFRQGKVEGEFGQLPSHFLIGADGVIAKVYHGETAVDHLPWASVGIFAKIPAAELKAIK